MNSRVLIVSTSIRKSSNSLAIAHYIKARIRGAQIMDIARRWDMSGLKEELGTGETLIIVVPLYHDTISWTATAFLEELAELPFPFRNMAAIVHSGYPEAVHRSAAVDICRYFAESRGVKWLGELSPGLTSVVAGRPLEEAGGLFRNLRKALDKAAAALERSEQIPDKAAALSKRSSVPPRLLKVMGNISFAMEAKRKGLDVKRQPYSRND